MALGKERKIAPNYTEGVDRKLLNEIRDRFLFVNQRRLERTYQGLSARQADILRILPILFQVNHPLLPGYVSHDVPHGISGYTPNEDALSVAAAHSRTFCYQLERQHSAQIHSLFIMGSSGTLAYSESSDVDAWLCISQKVNAEQEALLTRKAALIDEWANREGLQLHTFIMCAARFQAQRDVPAMDKESSGSAQHYLLLDEFYRTAILLAGNYPLWWLVPPNLEHRYAEMSALLLGKRFVKETEVIDFGGMTVVPKDELIGAGLWQLYKSLESPYKSALKLLLVEVYARELPQQQCLSVEFKQSVYDGESNLDRLDPYFLMYQRLEGYLNQENNTQRLELVRKSLYLKTGKKLSRRATQGVSSWQRALLTSLVDAWGWGLMQLSHLDKRSDWKVTEVLEERHALLAELTHAYRFLTTYARTNAIGSSITQQDTTLLGRKLYAVFQRKAGKIEHINLGIAPNMWEETLVVVHASALDFEIEHGIWMLYRSLPQKDALEQTPPLKKSSSLIELIAWLYFNGIATGSTRMGVMPGRANVASKDIENVLAAMTHEYPLPLPPVPQVVYQDSAQITHLLLLVNLDMRKKEGEQDVSSRISDRGDAISYSLRRVNLVETIDQIALSNWGEVTAIRYEVGETLLQSLQTYLQLCYEQPDQDVELSVKCFSSFRYAAIEERIIDLFNEVRSVFFSAEDNLNFRYVLEVGSYYFLCQWVETRFCFERLDTREMLMERLGRTEFKYQPIYLDSHAFGETSLLKSILPMNESNVIQVFYVYRGGAIELYVLDEHGSLLERTIPEQEEAMLQSSLFNFLSLAIERKQLNINESTFVMMPSIEFYAVKDTPDEVQIDKISTIQSLEVEPVVARGVVEGGELHYDFSYKGRDFSFTEFGARQYDELKSYYDSISVRQSIPLKLLSLSFPAKVHGVLRSEINTFGILDYISVFFDFEARLNELAFQIEQKQPDSA